MRPGDEKFSEGVESYPQEIGGATESALPTYGSSSAGSPRPTFETSGSSSGAVFPDLVSAGGALPLAEKGKGGRPKGVKNRSVTFRGLKKLTVEGVGGAVQTFLNSVGEKVPELVTRLYLLGDTKTGATRTVVTRDGLVEVEDNNARIAANKTLLQLWLGGQPKSLSSREVSGEVNGGLGSGAVHEMPSGEAIRNAERVLSSVSSGDGD